MSENELLEKIKQRNPNEPEFIQAVEEVISSVSTVFKKHPEYHRLKLLERMAEPERLISFRVNWLDDAGEVQVNRGFRVQMNSALGPYKGGLRFHPSVNQSILKFLAFEQIFKNALTGLPLGGGKGGADFNPKNRSDAEIMRFCQAFMSELYRHIGHFTDVPAGDIGVGSREIGFLFGTYKKLQNEFTGVLTGKGREWGGSLIRPEATGYGLVYFSQYMLDKVGDSLKDKICIVSGSGNVAQFTLEKLIELGAKPITASDSSGYIIDESGIDVEKLEYIKEIKNINRGRISEYIEKYPDAKYQELNREKDHNPLWKTKADCAFPCATQNEINKKDAANLKNSGVKLITEGANMPLTAEAIDIICESEILYAPGKATNAGGVAVSGLEMSQNRIGVYWSREEVDEKLKKIMKDIHDNCVKTAEEYDLNQHDYLASANIFGFLKVADAMKAQGVI
ncbi:glutamate dehydrogenase [Marivirga tractuosa]|uniref:Glutamate dehydrogenase n=1 Tax=Marivirga tractuosa (strain ATCC 23168 / DSM 4126 / NBRC 15989 / NCIMB 1408 / VKM B-1430 / H-43) TaxID=643867 RepID=E4TSR1_MARTH|nr:NADP-specific glutamate dehydrogenase [Marivirga tractuosa]ADR21871.1 glutamate dehydrogenase (NADP) [Marivirga tractuosa DSM 4126]BDD13671.1 glutamate dehydrogenase [Marivirga tractuosa]